MPTKTTEEPSASNGKLRFDVYEADPHAGELRKHGYRIRLEDRPFCALLILLRHANEVVTREELQKQLWPSDVFVDFDHGLNTAIAKIRRALNDSAENPRFIETVGRRGYRFLAEVAAEPQPAASSEHASSDSALKASPAATRDLGVGKEAGFSAEADAAQTAAAPAPAAASNSTPLPLVRKHSSWRVALAGLAATVLIVVGSLATYRLGGQPPALPFNTQQMRVRQVTEHGLAVYANISADGNYVAYLKRGDQAASLWVKQISTGSEVKIFAPQQGTFLETIAFSPDGTQVYFGHTSEENPAVFNLYAVPALGGSVRRVLSDTQGAAPSPDGARLAFVRWDPANGRTLLMLANSDGSGVHELASRNSKEGFLGGMPAWSPDGRLLAAVAAHNGNVGIRDIVVIPVAGGDPRILVTKRAFGQFAWLTDQGLLAAAFDFSAGFSRGSDRAQIYYQPYPNGDAVRFSNDTTHYTRVGADAAGDRLVAVNQDITTNVFVGPAGSPREIQQVTHEKIGGLVVDWISNDRLVAQDENLHLYSMDADGSNRTVLFDQAATSWLEHCGNHAIVFNRVAPNNEVGLWVLDLRGGGPRQLATGGFNMGGSCSLDGQWVYYSGLDSAPVRLMKIPFAGGQAVACGPPASSEPEVSPDGTLVLFRTTEGEGSQRRDVFAVMRTADGSLLPQKWQRLPGMDIFGWGPDAKSFVYVFRNHGQIALWEQPLNSTEARLIMSLGAQPKRLWSFAYSPDGKRLALIQGAETKDVVLFTNVRK